MTPLGHPRAVKKIVSGWAAFGDGWAIHAPTRKLVLKEYKKRARFYRELSKRAAVLEAQDKPDEKKQN